MLKTDLEMKNYSQQFLKPRKRLSKIYPDNRGALVAMNERNIVTFSKRGVVRGMHFQRKPLQSKTVMVIAGEILDVIVDCRPKAKTFGVPVGVHLKESAFTQLEIPAGFAHGYFCLTDAIVQYAMGADFNSDEQDAFAWNSSPCVKMFEPAMTKTLKPGASPIVSDRDAVAEQLMVFDPARFPFFDQLS